MRSKAIAAAITIGAGLAALVLATGFGVQAEEHKGVKIGEKLPDFTMTDFTGKEHSLEDYEDKVVVLIATSQHCPWVKGSDLHLEEIAKKYRDKGVVFLKFDSHSNTPPEDIKEYNEKRELTIPVLKDEQNEYADKVAATRTPEVYIVNKEHELVYHGAYDNRKVPEQKGDTNYVANALDALLAGEEIEPKEVNAWGCTIKRVAKN